MLNAHLVEGKSILNANMLKTGHPDKTDVFLLVYTFLSRSFKGNILYHGKNENIFDEIFKFKLVYTQTWPEYS